jgi:metallo-beta-lactamase family protein
LQEAQYFLSSISNTDIVYGTESSITKANDAILYIGGFVGLFEETSIPGERATIIRDSYSTGSIGLSTNAFQNGGAGGFVGYIKVLSDKEMYSAPGVLKDSANIMYSDAEELSGKFKRDYSPIYTEEDVDVCLKHYTEYPIGEVIALDEYVKFRFIPSGHILNSAQIELWVTCGNLTKKIVYTSDLGNIHIKKYYTTTFEPASKCDVLIAETTYARESKIANMKTRAKDLEKLESAIRQTCVEDKARVLLPVFANDRCQNMLTYLYDIFGNDDTFDIPILIDSPMAKRCCDAYCEALEGDDAIKWKEVLAWENIHFVEDHLESREWRDMNCPVVVLASSGMLVKGRSVGWVYDMLPKAKDRIIFCGFSAEGSIGAIIKEGKQKSITVSGKRRANRCQVTNLLSFTSHMQRDSLLKYYGSVQCEKIILVHGEMQGKIDFTKDLQKEISKNDNTSKVVVAQKGYTLSL